MFCIGDLLGWEDGTPRKHAGTRARVTHSGAAKLTQDCEEGFSQSWSVYWPVSNQPAPSGTSSGERSHKNFTPESSQY